MTSFNEYFAFSEEPFRLTPSVRFRYLSDSYRQSLRGARKALASGCCVVVVSGGAGTGKTLLLRELSRAAIGEQPGQLYTGGALPELADGPTAPLLIDDAQRVDASLLAELLRAAAADDIQLVLVGTPSLKSILANLAVPVPRDRMAFFKLAPLAEGEAKKYIAYRLAQAGYRGRSRSEPLFPEASVEALESYTGGNPGALNLLCSKALFFAHYEKRQQVTLQDVQAAINVCSLSDRSGEARAAPAPTSVAVRYRVPLAAGLLLALLAWLGVSQLTPPDRDPVAATAATVSPKQTNSPAPAPESTVTSIKPAAETVTPIISALPEPPAGLLPARVFVHHAAADTDDHPMAQQLVKYLQRSGYQVVDTRPVSITISSVSVRYFFVDDAPSGQQLVTQLQDYLRSYGGGAVKLLDFSHYTPKPRRGTVEVWLPALL